LGLVAAACTASGRAADKSGSRSEPLLLHLAVADYGLGNAFAIRDFKRRVQSLTGDSIQIQVLGGWGDYAPDAEQQVVQAVADGRVDLGVTSTGVFDSLGVTSFEALSAPLLIDSNELANAVLESDLPRQMLDGLSQVGVRGIGIAFQSLVYPLSEDRPLVDVPDWSGVRVGTLRSKIQEAAIRALGARPVEVFGPARDAALDANDIRAFDFGIYGYRSEFHLGMAEQVPYVAANVVLWPRFNVLLANPELLSSLSEDQRGWLQRAMAQATALSARQDGKEGRAVRVACRRGARFASASLAELHAMRSALAPVYQRLRQDPRTSTFLREIKDLEGRMHPQPLHVPPRCVWAPPS
jgi:TRAP-type C4-dicarboxylate transport system substrate-binding protein